MNSGSLFPVFGTLMCQAGEVISGVAGVALKSREVQREPELVIPLLLVSRADKMIVWNSKDSCVGGLVLCLFLTSLSLNPEVWGPMLRKYL